MGSSVGWFFALLDWLVERGASPSSWLVLLVCVVCVILWKAKRFKMLIEWSADDSKG